MIQARDEKSEGLAVFLSFLWMGLGQMYVGRIGRGIVLAILGLLLGAPILLFLGMLFSPILVIFLPL
jgi:TM2 domain-containing membrane protein YozV